MQHELLLCQYKSFHILEWMDLNHRIVEPKSTALPDLATLQILFAIIYYIARYYVYKSQLEYVSTWISFKPRNRAIVLKYS